MILSLLACLSFTRLQYERENEAVQTEIILMKGVVCECCTLRTPQSMAVQMLFLTAIIPPVRQFHQYLGSRALPKALFLHFQFRSAFHESVVLHLSLPLLLQLWMGKVLDGASFIMEKVSLFWYNHSGSKIRRSISCSFSPSVSRESQFMLSSLFITVGEGLRSSLSVYSVLGSLSQ